MKHQIKISGKKQPWADLSREELAEWNFETRPGGWVIGSKTKNGVTERIRFFYRRVKNQFWAKLPTGNFFGEKIAITRAGHAGGGASDLTAQFPGKVRKILVAAGAKVEEGVPLLMVEAMKMEFAIKAPAAGTVNKILVTEGQSLTPGQLLIDFTESQVAESKLK